MLSDGPALTLLQAFPKPSQLLGDYAILTWQFHTCLLHTWNFCFQTICKIKLGCTNLNRQSGWDFLIPNVWTYETNTSNCVGLCLHFSEALGVVVNWRIRTWPWVLCQEHRRACCAAVFRNWQFSWEEHVHLAEVGCDWEVIYIRVILLDSFPRLPQAIQRLQEE